ncbi:MAG: LysM peptidoglycan-binding domain-containing protein [Clostridia bacterium]
MTQTNSAPGTKCAEEYVVKRGDSFYLIAHKLGVPLRDLLAANRDIHPARLMVGDVLCIPREEDETLTGGLTGTGTSGSTLAPAPVTPTPMPTTPAPVAPTPAVPIVPAPLPATPTTPAVPSPAPVMPAVPTPAPVAPSPTTPAVPSTPCPPGEEIAPSCPVEDQFIIQKGQTVADVQLRSLLSRHTLDSANPQVDLETLRVGQTICVPKENVPCKLPNTYTLGVAETLEAVSVIFNLPIASLLRANPCLAPQDFEPGVTVVLPQ